MLPSVPVVLAAGVEVLLPVPPSAVALGLALLEMGYVRKYVTLV
jgi:hypothetical protein